MLHGTYVGSEPGLNGEKALLMPCDGDHWKAQFDDLSLPHDLTHGWTVYPKNLWVLDSKE